MTTVLAGVGVSEIVGIAVGAITIVSFVVGGLVWLLAPRLAGVVEKTVNGKIDVLTRLVTENAAQAEHRHEESLLAQREMHGNFILAAERHEVMKEALAHQAARLDALQARMR